MSSGNNYYEFQSAKVAIAMELVKRGWKLYGFHEDESDMMTDYWSPAYWDGIATKDGFVVVIDCSNNRNSEREIREYNYTAEAVMSLKVKELIMKLMEVRQERGASAAEEATAQAKIKKLQEKSSAKVEKYVTVDRYPKYQPNPPKMTWHVEKDGVIIAKGNGIAKFSDMKGFDRSYSEEVLKSYDPGTYRYDKAERLLALSKKFDTLLNKIDSAAGCMIGGKDKKGYVYTNIDTIEYKKENKAVECSGEIREGQCFIVKEGRFNRGIQKGYVYIIHKVDAGNGKAFYTTTKLDRKLKKELNGRANPANSFGILAGTYVNRFLGWVEKGWISWCEIQEVETPYTVQKCVKRKVG